MSIEEDINHSLVMVGPWTTDWLSVTPSTPHNTVTLIVPGNPGIVRYYEEFCLELYQRLERRSAVWVVSHTCHTEQDPTCNSTVDREVKHKVMFIQKFVPRGSNLRLVGHSIGCQMILKALDRLTARTPPSAEEQHQEVPCSSNHFTLGQCYLLFPTIERMKDTPRGRHVWPVLQYLWWLPPFLGACMAILPQFIKDNLVRMALYDGSSSRKLLTSVVESAVINARPDMIRNMLDLARDELIQVTDLDLASVRRHKDRLVFYYGHGDAWCPVEYKDELVRRVPGVVAFLCQNKIDHAFVVRMAKDMAQELTAVIASVEELRCVPDTAKQP